MSLLIIAGLLSALVVSSYLSVDFWFCFILCCLASCSVVIGVSFLWAKVSAWRDDHQDKIWAVIKKMMMALAVLLSVVIIYRWSIPTIPASFLLVTAYGAVRYRQSKVGGTKPKMLVTIAKGGGSFRNTWVVRPEDKELWCAGYDQDHHGIAIRRVDENEKHEGHVTVEDNTKTVRLFMWNGNADAKGGSYFFIGMIQNPGQGIPRDADLLTEIVF